MTLVMQGRHYHKDATLPTQPDVIFVFGSNLAGIHGAGAAKVAHSQFRAITGQGEGRQGQSYAIPTKGYHLQCLSLQDIAQHVCSFCEYTFEHPELRFFVTAVGCGLAGNKPQDIAPLFRNALNCSFPQEWKEFLEQS